ncbi:hypothetical protein ABZV34_36790, partial [Streptomyces sp. NPDC005195]|uniref:hypothetical protein n=1 Tax=Streptomyces sp. NPDC005195 TaxID=3154561 RepID=UPI0033A242AD
MAWVGFEAARVQAASLPQVHVLHHQARSVLGRVFVFVTDGWKAGVKKRKNAEVGDGLGVEG